LTTWTTTFRFDGALTLADPTDTLRHKLIRNVGDVALQRQQRAPLYDTMCGGVSDGTAASKLGAGYDELPAGQRSCPYHYHLAQEEMFVILEGQGTLRVADQMLPVRAGDVVMIPPGPDYPHQFINTSSAVMKYLSISTQERPEMCVYPDSGKVYAYAPGARLLNRQEGNLDYWDGEP
jgi:uncharacterized cupin superfamily protein